MYAVIDVETGGFSKEKNGLVEIAVIIVNNEFIPKWEKSYIVAPYLRRDSEDELVSYKDDAMAVHGITMEEVENGEDAEDVFLEIEQSLIENSVHTIIAHNVSFDKRWTEELLERFGDGFKFKHTLCTMKKAKENKVKTENFKLPTLLKHFGIENKAEHRALGDAKATLELIIKLTK